MGADLEQVQHQALALLLQHELEGARVEKATQCRDSKAIALWLFLNGEKKLLLVGAGATVTGVGMLQPNAKIRGDATAQVTNALRAHITDQRIRSVSIEDGILWISAGGSGLFSRIACHLGRKGGVLVYAPDGSTVATYTVQRELASSWQGVAIASSIQELQTIGSGLLARIHQETREREYRELGKLVRTELQSYERRHAAISKDYERISSVKTLQKIGRLLMHQSATIATGTTEVVLDDWEDGGQITIALEPARPARAQADAYFAKAFRFKRSEPVVRKRLEDTARTITALRALSEQWQALIANDEVGWTAFVENAKSQGIRSPITNESPPLGVPALPSGRNKNVPPERRVAYHTFFDARGRKILVGRGAKDNDTLTTEIAKPHDLWLHVKNQHGAHVVVPLQKGHNVDPETLADAATLAAHFSDARGETVCEVTYVSKRYVRKPRGSAVGAVTCDHEKVLVLRLEPKRLERLLAASKER